MAKIWKPEPQLLESLDGSIPDLLASQKENGQFGAEPWICHDQNIILALAAAWSIEGSIYHHNDEVLDAIVRGGYALIDAQDEEGKWTFRKKDHSTWGQIFMPWTYSRWVRAYLIMRDAMPGEAQRRWEDAMALGFEGVSRTCLDHIHNIPTHHAMALYCAGIVFEREDWKTQAQEFIHRVLETQTAHGWWSENSGPVVSYNYVYSEAIGVYHALSGDERVLDALERAARFHANYVYPDGSAVETVDQRNPYHQGVRLGNPGFSYTPAGRGYLAQQHAIQLETGEPFAADYAANMLLYAGEGEMEETAAGRDRHTYRMGDEALIRRARPWFLSLSAFVCPVPQSRWIQDRQNLFSVFHDDTGLIIGGGNTKLQPLWSNFTVGETSLLSHTPGDEAPDFTPRDGLIHVPESASIETENGQATLVLQYGEETCKVTLAPVDESRLEIAYETTTHSGMSVEGHVILLPHLNEKLRLAHGDEVELTEAPLDITGADWIEHAGWRLSLPEGARVVWPILPHNPYRKGGEAEISEARLVVVLPFSNEMPRHQLTLEII